METLRSAVRFTVGFLSIVGVSAALTMAVDHVAVQARNNEKTVASPAPAAPIGASDALEASATTVASDESTLSDTTAQ
ncbi:MAG: hypothetical protein HGA67_04265 [Candidatus Yonathbacteria bacterium]|nr:hypothetical protein [Candidatus Yonathbacteria bacterium]